VGSNIAISIEENSYATPVNAIQAGFTYPSNLLQLVSLTTTSSAFSSSFSPTSQTPGSILISQASVNGNLTGNQLVATATFTVVSPGIANLAYTPSCQQSIAANCTGLGSNGTVIASATPSASFTLRNSRSKK
jgi:hypothetical protein